MSGKPHAFQQLEPFRARGGFVAIEHLDLRQRQVLDNRQMREQFKVLEHHPDVRAQFGQVGLFIVNRGAVDDDLTLLNGSRPLTVLISVDLPEPDGPQTTTTSPFFTSVEQSVST
jgi:hypothetical protein